MGKQNPETAPSRFILFRIVKNFKQLLIFGGVILVGIIETKLSRKPLFWISVFFSTYFPCIRIHLVLDGNPKKIKTLWN